MARIDFYNDAGVPPMQIAYGETPKERHVSDTLTMQVRAIIRIESDLYKENFRLRYRP